MTNPRHTPTQADPARIRAAGALYAVIILTGLGAELALRGPLISPGDAEATARAIRSGMGTFRAALVADVVMVVADIALALAFFALFRACRPGLALAAMVFRLMQAALIGASLLVLASVPLLLSTGEDVLALHMTALHATGYDVGLILFGINSLIMAQLFRSSALPRIIALGIAGSGLVYITGGLLRLAAPEMVATIQPAYLLPMLAETALCLWLLITARL